MSGSGSWFGGQPPRLGPRRVAEALKQAGGDVTRAAKLMGASRSTVHRYLDAYPSLRRILAEQRAKQAVRGPGEDGAAPRDERQDVVEARRAGGKAGPDPVAVRALAADDFAAFLLRLGRYRVDPTTGAVVSASTGRAMAPQRNPETGYD